MYYPGMSDTHQDDQRTLGLLGATGVGVGAIVGGGIMVLAGTAFASTGPSALVAFAVNGVIALVTAMSFAEMSASFPESGGAYTFAKKVLSVRAAFAVGWVLWFAYIVAGVLYALGFSAFAVLALQEAWLTFGSTPPEFLTGRRILLLLASGATVGYAFSLIRQNAGGGQYATIGKMVIFSILVLFGLIALVGQPLEQTSDALTPFFSDGMPGLFTAMGFTFIALQGFDLIAAIAGEVREPGKNIPRAMFLSLFIALAVYLPLLFLISTVGVPDGASITALASSQGDTVFATAVSEFMGTTGYWMVIGAAILSTLSALNANLLAASRVASTMAQDHTLPVVLATAHPTRGTPAMAIYATALTLVAIVFMVPNVSAAGAAASLIFLISFALTHATAYLSRQRGGSEHAVYRTPMFPLIPVAGGLACAAMAVFQAIMVPDAGGIIVIWLGLGVILYVALFKQGAESADASAEGLDPHLIKLRGKNPLVLLPVANPATARALVDVANTMAPSEYARVLLLTIIARANENDDPRARLADAQRVVRKALTASYADCHAPEALITTAADPWQEIRRVAKDHDCESLLLGLGEIPDEYRALDMKVESLLEHVDCDVAFLRSPSNWQLADVTRVLVPVGGRGHGHELRARVLGSLCRSGAREITFMTVRTTNADDATINQAERYVREQASKIRGQTAVRVHKHDDPAEAIVHAAEGHGLLILGLGGTRWGQKIFGELALRIARDAPCAVMLLSGKRSRAYSELYRPLRDAVNVLPWSGSDKPTDNPSSDSTATPTDTAT